MINKTKSQCFICSVVQNVSMNVKTLLSAFTNVIIVTTTSVFISCFAFHSRYQLITQKMKSSKAGTRMLLRFKRMISSISDSKCITCYGHNLFWQVELIVLRNWEMWAVKRFHECLLAIVVYRFLFDNYDCYLYFIFRFIHKQNILIMISVLLKRLLKIILILLKFLRILMREIGYSVGTNRD